MTDAFLHEPALQGRLLVADDDEPSRRLLRDLFRKQGYTVTEARNGEEALNLARAAPPDVILLDVMMPRLDGLEACRRLKDDARTRPVPVLLVTALHERADRLKGMACGANDFISKPFDTEEILLRVRNALRLKRLHDEVRELLSKRETLSDMIVHDIRNPLLAIRLTAMQIAGAPNPDAATSLANEIIGQAGLIDRFISDLLDVSRLEQPSFRLDRSLVDLSRLARIACENQRRLAETKHLQVRVVCPECPCETSADANLLVRLLENLLNNAIKYSPAGREVRLSICPQDATHPSHRILVEDDGPGIPLDYRDTIFNKYTCLQSTDPSIHQTGLGLAFCRMVAEAHGGRISVASRQPHGSLFTVELPAASST